MNQVSPQTAPAALAQPQIRLHGPVNDAMLATFKDAFAAAETSPDPIVLELTTGGGDADVGRRIGCDVRLYGLSTGKRPLFFGKTTVFSAGVSIMAGFPRESRWLAKGTRVLIHDRSLARTVDLNGPLPLARQQVQALMNEIDVSLQVEREGFEALIEGSDVGIDELLRKAPTNWYLDADEALARGLIAGVA